MSATRPRLRLLQVTDFTPEGTEELYRLFNDSILHGGTIGFLRPMTRRKAQEYFESLKSSIHKGETIAVVSGTKPFTGFGLIRRDDGELFRHCWEMGRVMVRPTMQRHGLGAAIVQRLVAEAKRRKIEMLWLDVRITNVPAIELFQKIGFRTWGIFPNRIKAGREYADVLYMACDLRTTYHPLRDLP